MVMAKVLTAKADLPSTVAAMLAFTQAAAAAVGVLAVARTPSGLLNIPTVELVLVCIATSAVAVVLAVGCMRILTGGSTRLTTLASATSLVISVYWIFLRPPAEGFPDIAVAYAVLPVLILGLLGLSHVLAARPAKDPIPVAAADEEPTEPDDEPAAREAQRPWQLADELASEDGAEESEGAPRRDMLVE